MDKHNDFIEWKGIFSSNNLLKFLMKRGITKAATFSDGALLNPIRFHLAGIETNGAILFADLPGFSKLGSQLQSAECAYIVNHFFAWFEGEAIRHFGGIVDKFIGDEVMIIFPHTECKLPPLEAAMHTARAMLENDPWAFDPKIGIAAGSFMIALVGTQTTGSVTAIGHTVNLAARCVGYIKRTHTIKIATSDIDLVKGVFNDEVWEVLSPKQFRPKHMSPVSAIDVFRKTEWVPNFDYLKKVKKNVEWARSKGAIKNNS